jgi:ATP-dependent Zn protease
VDGRAPVAGVPGRHRQPDRCPAPELLRKGRFDEVFFVDLPDAATREQLFALHLRKRKLDAAAFDLPALAAASDGFSGAEVEQAIVSALFAAHATVRRLSDFALRAELKQPGRCRC